MKISGDVALIIVVLVFFILDWVITKIDIGEPFNRAIRVILIFAAVPIVISAILSMVGHPFIRW